MVPVTACTRCYTLTLRPHGAACHSECGGEYRAVRLIAERHEHPRAVADEGDEILAECKAGIEQLATRTKEGT